MTGIKELIINKSLLLKDEVIRLRRHFHKYPELSYQEYETASFICSYLEQHNIGFRNGVAGTGIIGRIDGNGAGKTVIAVRAEMDALPVTEDTGLPFSSINTGRMHACGHDAHMAMLMGTGILLNELRDYFGGTILLVFQPGEEKSPGGARLMLESGELSDPGPDIFLAQHILPELETGRVGYKPGEYMASCDEIYLTVSGKGGHAALPHLTTDQVLIASKLIVSLKEAIDLKKVEQDASILLGIGRISGEGATNVIPSKVEIAGTLRTFSGRIREESKELIARIADETAGRHGVDIRLRIEEGYPALLNNEILTGEAIRLSGELLGRESVEIYKDLRMSSDDFSFYSSAAPSLYFRIGIRKKGTTPRSLHSALFDIDEEGLATGIANMAWLVISFLSGVTAE